MQEACRHLATVDLVVLCSEHHGAVRCAASRETYAAHIYNFGAEPDGLLWIAMELVRGTSLRDLLATQGRS